MKKTTIVILPQHRAAYEARRQLQPSLALTQFYSDAMTFYLQHGDESSLRPAIKAQQALITKLDRLETTLGKLTMPAIDHGRLEQHSKYLGEQVSASIQHLERGVQTAGVQAITQYRRVIWRTGALTFGMGAVVGAGIVWLSGILW